MEHSYGRIDVVGHGRSRWSSASFRVFYESSSIPKKRKVRIARFFGDTGSLVGIFFPGGCRLGHAGTAVTRRASPT